MGRELRKMRVSHADLWGKTFQAERTAGTKSLRWRHAGGCSRHQKEASGIANQGRERLSGDKVRKVVGPTETRKNCKMI